MTDQTSSSTAQNGADEGLMQDLAAFDRLRVGRRKALSLFGVSGAALLTGCGPDDSSGGTTVTPTATATPTPTTTATATPTPTPTASGTACTLYATETNGPYPADGTNSAPGATSNALTASGVLRSDIRTSFIGSATAAPGVALSLTIRLVDVNNACAPLVGYAVYLWHCSATGQYSLYDVPGESWLRGMQVSDSNGQVTFTTIWPGCYAGRFPHIHFEVFSSLTNATRGNFARLISQFAMPDAINRDVYLLPQYGTSASNYSGVSVVADNVFANNTAAQMTVMTVSATGSAAAGFTGTVVVGMTT